MLTAQARRPAWAWFDRLVPAMACTACIAVAFSVAYAAESGSPITLLVIIALAVPTVGVAAKRRRSPVERPWDAARLSSVSGPDRWASVGAIHGGAPSRWRVVAALGRVEARELACSPWFAIGVGFELWIFITFGVWYAEEDLALWAETIKQLVAFSHPLVGTVVVAAHAATTRGRHDGAEELFTSCPVGITTRTSALLATAWVPAVSLAAFLTALLVAAAALTHQVYGPAGRDAVPDLIGAVTLGVGGAVLGVAVGRWAPSRLAPVVAVVAVGALSLRMAAAGGGWAELSTFVTMAPEVFVHRAAWWHLVWLVGLTMAVGGVALARSVPDRRRLRPSLVVCGVGAAVALVGGVLATRPMPASAADLLADRVARPAAHQGCARAGIATQVCAYHGYGELRDRIVAEVAPVVAALPPAAGPVTLRQVFPGSLHDLPPEVRRRLPAGIPSLPPGEVALSLEPADDHVVASRFLVALAALGLPVEPEQEPRSGPRPEVVAGQARGVVALWLAARGLGPTAARDLSTAKRRGQRGPTPPSADAFDRGFAWPTSCETAPVVWSAQDLAAARVLLALPAAQVTAMVHAGWDRWRDPAATTDQLLTAVGLPAVGPSDTVVSRDPGWC